MGTLGERRERELVADFLKRVRNLAERGRLHFENREVNNKTLAYLCLKYEHAREIVLSLTVEDYLCGVGLTPKHEHEERCDFGVFEGNEPVYIKLVIDNDRGRAICVSFHIARWDLAHKFRDGGDAE